MRRTVVLGAMLLCIAASAEGQAVDTTQVQSDKQKRQRAWWTLTQANNEVAAWEAQVALDSAGVALGILSITRLTASRAGRAAAYTMRDHATILWSALHAEVVRDSLRHAAPADTLVIPPAPDTVHEPPVDTVPPPPDLLGVHLVAGDGQSAAVGESVAAELRVVVWDSAGAPVAGVQVTFRPLGSGSRFAGCGGTDGGFIPTPAGSSYRTAVTAADGVAVCQIWQILEPGTQRAEVDAGLYGTLILTANPTVALGEYLDLVITMTGAQGSAFAMQIGDVREFCAIGIYEHGTAAPPDPVDWIVSDSTVLQLGGQGPTGPHCRLVTALREADDPLGLGLAPRSLIAWIESRRAR